MTRTPRIGLVVALAMALVVSACGGDATEETTTTTTPAPTTTAPTTTSTSTTTTTTRPESTTVTTFPEAFAAPLTGLRPDDATLRDRRMIAVKVDNHPRARPQSGLQEAEAVFEIIVEGGLTRFIALFHTTDSSYVGPIRSLRPTDPILVAPLGGPLAISGGQAWIQSIAVSAGVRLIGEGAGTFRVASRAAPHNLYGRTPDFRMVSDQRGYADEPPQQLLPLDDWEYPDQEATEIRLDWAAGSWVTWRYDPERQVYLRWTNDTRHDWVDASGDRDQVETDVLLVLEGRYYEVSPPAGQTGSPVPAIDILGSGRAHVFSHGRVWVGTWQRAQRTDPFTLFNEDGTPASVPAGRPWISIYPAGQPVTFE